MENAISYAGLDVHKSEIVVALYRPDKKAAVEWRLGTDARSVKRLAQRLLEESAGRLVCVYEAGPTGFVLQRQLTGYGVKCEVAAPSLVPVKPGQHIRTDRRDARKLGHYLRSGDLTFVRPPNEAEEAAREPRVVYESEEGLRVGSHVRHGTFGVGTIKQVEGAGEKQKVTVVFRSVGAKKLLLKFAGLEPV